MQQLSPGSMCHVFAGGQKDSRQDVHFDRCTLPLEQSQVEDAGQSSDDSTIHSPVRSTPQSL